MYKPLAVLVVALALAGCGTINNEQQGAVLGAVVGGVVGNQIGSGVGRAAATFAGVLIGSAVGSNIGRMMDYNDRRQVAYALETSPSGAASAWRNPDTGARYEVTPGPAYRSNGRVCREYATTAYIDDRRERVIGLACRQPDGSWRVQ